MRHFIDIVTEETSNPAEALIADYETWKSRNFPQVTMTLEEYDIDAVGVIIESSDTGKGYASACLRQLCDMADAHQVTLQGQIYGGFGDDRGSYGTVNRALLAWYSRYGFQQWDEDEPGIVRYPQA